LDWNNQTDNIICDHIERLPCINEIEYRLLFWNS
jgi:hypothetical protein